MAMLRETLHSFRIASQPPGIYSGFNASSLERVAHYTAADTSQNPVSGQRASLRAPDIPTSAADSLSTVAAADYNGGHFMSFWLQCANCLWRDSP